MTQVMTEPTNGSLARPDADESEVARRLVNLFLERLAAQDADGIQSLFAERIDWFVPGDGRLPWTGVGRAVQRLASTSVLYGQLSKPARVLWFLTPSWCKGERWSCSHFSSTWRLPRDAGFRHQLRCASRFRMVKLFDYICTKIPPP